MRVLLACEYSGTVRDAWRALGHDAVSCDLLPGEGDGPHIQGDALDVAYRRGPYASLPPWDAMIAFPPCTRLTNSGVRWLNERNLWGDMKRDAAFFVALRDAPIPRRAIENPTPHGHARLIIGEPSQAVHPWYFGDNETKRTCLWLRGFPLLRPTHTRADYATPPHARVWLMSPGPERAKERARFSPGMARAMAAQWSTTHA